MRGLPSLPPTGCFHRPVLMQTITAAIASLLDGPSKAPPKPSTYGTVIVHGFAGNGKSVVVNLVCRQMQLRKRLSPNEGHAMVYAYVGPEGSVVSVAQRIAQDVIFYANPTAICSLAELFSTEMEAKEYFHILQAGRVLCLLDDVWTSQFLSRLRAVLPASFVLLVSSRDQRVGGAAILVETNSLDNKEVLEFVMTVGDRARICHLLEQTPAAYQIILDIAAKVSNSPVVVFIFPGAGGGGGGGGGGREGGGGGGRRGVGVGVVE